ncbi:MAG: hypothetical protein HFE77_08310 [Clostridiales bacterium]|nr:hypothetical protein [Clostridiales bacterium]
MLCDKCKKRNATVLYKQTVNGVSEQMALCSECANQMSIGGLFDDDFNFFGSLFKGSGSALPSEDKVCTLCGSTFEQIARDGKVGCAKCYEIFEDRLRPSIERLHGRVEHIGRKPKGSVQRDEKQEKLKELKEQLAASIEKENFEEAAKLRDEIRGLEG